MERRDNRAEISQTGFDSFEFTTRLDDLSAETLVPIDLVVAGLCQCGVNGRDIGLNKRFNP